MLDVTIREARPEDADAIARVQVETWHTTFRGVLPGEYLSGIKFEKRAPVWAEKLSDESRTEFVYVAETAGGRVVGFASGGPEREGDAEFDGELYAIYVLEDFQRRGAGRRLTRAVVERLAALGFGSMLLWALEVNAAGRGFYEGLDGRLVRRGELARGGPTLPVVAYGWPDIDALRDRLKEG